MDYSRAYEAYKIVEELKLNNADICRFQDAINNGITAAQITIQSKNGTYTSTRYENDRLNLLLQVLHNRNMELMEKLEKLEEL